MIDSIEAMRVSTHQALFNHRVPSEVDAYLGFLFPILAFDYLQIDSLYEMIPGFEWDPFLPRFEAIGYESK